PPVPPPLPPTLCVSAPSSRCVSPRSLHDALPISAPLLELGWLLEDAELELAELFALLRKNELAVHFAELGELRGQRKEVQLQARSEEHTSELQSRENLVCRRLLEKKKQPFECTVE